MERTPPDDSTDDLNAALARIAEKTDRVQPALVRDEPPPSRPTPPEGPEAWPTGPASEPELPEEPLESSDQTDPAEAPLRLEDQTLIRSRIPADGPYTLEAMAGPALGQALTIGRRPMVVGRALGAIRVEDPFVSEGHASFYVRNGEPLVADGGAPSGVFVEVARRVALAEGDVFACGLQVFRFLGVVDVRGAVKGVYGAPHTFKAFRLEHLLVGGRSGRIIVFRHLASVGRTQGSLQFPDDLMLDDLHVELKAGPHGMALVTHSQRWPAFMRIPTGAEVVLEPGALVRVGTSTFRVVVRPTP